MQNDISQQPHIINNKSSDWRSRTDRIVAILGSSLPVSLILGVVVFEFFIGLTGLVWLISKVKFSVRGRGGVTAHAIFWPIMCWFFVIMASRIVNGGSAYQIANDLAFLRFPLFIIAMVDVSTRMPVHRYLIGGILVGIVYAGLNLLSAYLIGFDFIGKPLTRYVEKMKEGVKIGAFCAYAAPFLLIWGAFERKLETHKRIGIIGLGCIAIVLLILTKCRTAFLAAMIGAVGGILGLLIVKKKMKIRTVLAIFIIAGLGGWWVLSMQPSLESMYDRFFIWKTSFQVWLHNPVFGVGISSFNDAYRQMAESGIVTPIVSPVTGEIYHSVDPRHAHNMFLQLLACNGVLGLAAFGWFFWTVVKMVRNFVNSWCAGLWCWPFICLVIGLTGWNIYDPFYTTIVFYFLALICVGANLPAGRSEAKA
jgi:hypothetical protein